MENKDVICTNLKRIREQKGLNQEDFYKKYLLKHSFINPRGEKEVPSDASIQDWMKKLEHGIFPKRIIELLSVYADIGDTSVDSIIGRTTSGGKAETASDVLSFLFGFDLDKDIVIKIEDEKFVFPDGKEQTIQKPYIHFKSFIPFAISQIDKALCQWNEVEHSLKAIGFEGIDEYMEKWKKGWIMDLQDVRPDGSQIGAVTWETDDFDAGGSQNGSQNP